MTQGLEVVPQTTQTSPNNITPTELKDKMQSVYNITSNNSIGGQEQNNNSWLANLLNSLGGLGLSSLLMPTTMNNGAGRETNPMLGMMFPGLMALMDFYGGNRGGGNSGSGSYTISNPINVNSYNPTGSYSPTNSYNTTGSYNPTTTQIGNNSVAQSLSPYL